MAKKNSCGGLLFNEQDFKEIDGILTFETSESVDSYFVSHYCGGQKFDTEVFQEYKVGNHYVIGEVDSDLPTNIIKANCSMLFDGDIIEINKDGAIQVKGWH